MVLEQIDIKSDKLILLTSAPYQIQMKEINEQMSWRNRRVKINGTNQQIPYTNPSTSGQLQRRQDPFSIDNESS